MGDFWALPVPALCPPISFLSWAHPFLVASGHCHTQAEGIPGGQLCSLLRAPNLSLSVFICGLGGGRSENLGQRHRRRTPRPMSRPGEQLNQDPTPSAAVGSFALPSTQSPGLAERLLCVPATGATVLPSDVCVCADKDEQGGVLGVWEGALEGEEFGFYPEPQCDLN